MLFFLKGRFGEDVAHQNEAVFLGGPGKEVVAVTGLGFTGKGGEDILFGLRAFQRFHESSFGMMPVEVLFVGIDSNDS